MGLFGHGGAGRVPGRCRDAPASPAPPRARPDGGGTGPGGGATGLAVLCRPREGGGGTGALRAERGGRGQGTAGTDASFGGPQAAGPVPRQVRRPTPIPLPPALRPRG